MKPSILVPFVFALVVVISPAFAASGKAKDEARRGCKRNFGGTSELLRIDKESGFAYCRTGRLVVKFPFRWRNAKKVKPLPDPVRAPAPVSASTARTVSPVSPVPCKGCEGALGAQHTPMPSEAVLSPSEDTTLGKVVPRTSAAQPELLNTKTAIITKPTREELIARYGRGLFEQAVRICVMRNGSGSTVDFIDERSWRVVCRASSQP